MATRKGPGIRVEQRLRTEARILAEARKTFAELGYERTTIRAVATAAHVDPGLVMHYFGSKEALFARVVETPEDKAERPVPASLEELVERVTAEIVAVVDRKQVSELAMMRSMLTQPEVARAVRAKVAQECDQLAQVMPGDDAVLRAHLLGLTVMTVVIGRHLLELEGLQDVPADTFAKVLRPCIEALTYAGEKPTPPTP